MKSTSELGNMTKQKLKPKIPHVTIIVKENNKYLYAHNTYRTEYIADKFFICMKMCLQPNPTIILLKLIIFILLLLLSLLFFQNTKGTKLAIFSCCCCSIFHKRVMVFLAVLAY
jgi:hypothetical protein